MFYFVAISCDETFEQWFYDAGSLYQYALDVLMSCGTLEDCYYIYNHKIYPIPMCFATLTQWIRTQQWQLPRALSDKGAVVPHTRCRRGCYRYFRHPHTMRSRRQLRGLDILDGIYVRGKQCHLPSSWDDIGRSDASIRTWKSHRKTQYKTV